jgi:hypothetical protein
MAQAAVWQELDRHEGVRLLRLSIPPAFLSLPSGWTCFAILVAVPRPPGPGEAARTRQALETALERWHLSGRKGIEWPEEDVPGHRVALMALCLSRPDGLSVEVGYNIGAAVYSLVAPPGADMGDVLSFLRRARRAALFVRDRGRPPGSGTFPSRDEALRVLRQAARAVKATGKRPSQANVAEYVADRGLTVATDPRDTLRHWLKTYGISWREVVER